MENNVHPEDRIAFPSFRSFLVSFFRTVFKMMDLLNVALRRNVLLLIVGAILGGLIGLVYHLYVVKKFRVSMLVEYTALDKPAYASVLDQLNTLVYTDSRSTLATDLKISPLLSENISGISGQNVKGRPMDQDSSFYPFFTIVVDLKTPFGADSLGQALLTYINDLPYLKKQKEDQIRLFQGRLSYIDQTMTKIDSLNHEYVRTLGANKMTSGFYNNAFDPANLYGQSYKLDSLRGAIQGWLNNNSQPVKMVKGFRSTARPITLSRTASIILFILGGFLIALFFATMLELNKKLNGA
jgi:hypothetical protein